MPSGKSHSKKGGKIKLFRFTKMEKEEAKSEEKESTSFILEKIQQRKRKREEKLKNAKLLKLATAEKVEIREEDEVVTDMYEIQQAQKDLEEEALFQKQQNWGKEDSCTFHEGYKKQPVYACATCSKDSKEVMRYSFENLKRMEAIWILLRL